MAQVNGVGEARTTRPITVWLAVVASLGAGLFRLIPFGYRPPNFTPVGAAGLFAGGKLPWWAAYLLPLAIMGSTDALLYWIKGDPFFNRSVYACFLIYVLIGQLLCRTRSPLRIGAANFLGALQFYLITNFMVWFNSHGLPHAMYPPTWAGLLECYVMGLPFFGYTLAGDLTFSTAFFGAEAWLTREARTTERAIGDSV